MPERTVLQFNMECVVSSLSYKQSEGKRSLSSYALTLQLFIQCPAYMFAWSSELQYIVVNVDLGGASPIFSPF